MEDIAETTVTGLDLNSGLILVRRLTAPMRLSKLCCSLANVLILSEVALAADSHHWPFQIAGKLPDRDINAIVSVISHTKGIDHRICWIEVKTPSEVWVFTGKITGIQQGGGDMVTVRKHGKRWSVFDDGSQSSWVL